MKFKPYHDFPKSFHFIFQVNFIRGHEYRRRDREYQKKKGKVSKKEELDKIRKEIKSLREQGLKNKDIMQMLQIKSTTTFERHISYLKKNGLL